MHVPIVVCTNYLSHSLPVFFLFALYSVMASVQAVTRETAVSADRSGVVTWSASPTPTSSVASKGNRKHSFRSYTSNCV